MRPSSSRALIGAVAGGALAGGIDAAVALSRGAAGVRGTRLLGLAGLGLGLGALAGLLLVGLVLALFALARQLRAPDSRAAVIVGGVLAAPLATYDAFSLFAGAKASRVPGHQAISTALALLGVAAAALLAGQIHRALVHAPQRPGRTRLLALTAFGTAALLFVANRVVLPRLYPWFHTTLTLLFLGLMVQGALFALAARASSRPGRVALLVGIGVATAVAVVSWSTTARSQAVRFVALEKTQLISLLMRQIPAPTAPRRAGPALEQATLPPFPDGPRRPDADVVVITVDALRADHVGAYGYRRPTTPNIDALARRGVRFERAYTQAPNTSYAVTSMLTGKYYPTLARLAPNSTQDVVPQILRRYGWKTAAFYPPAVFYIDPDRLAGYKNSQFQFEYVKEEFLDADKRLEQIKAFFDSERPKRAFLWLHLFEPHEDYVKHSGFDFGNGDLDRYDSEIAFSDAAIGQIVGWLEKNRPGTIVIISADHGEEFDEHNGRYHGSSLYEEQIRVPLIIAIPGVSPRVISGPVELIDLAPTILGLLDIPIPVRMRGTNLGPWLATPPAPNDRLPPAFAELNDKRTVIWGTDKLYCELNFGVCSYFDLKTDPGEKKNLADERPDRTAALKAQLDRWLDDHVRFEPELARGLANPQGGAVPRAIERGRLGDLEVMEELAALLLSDQDVAIRREAARLLVKLPPREETRVKVLEAFRASKDQEVRDWCAVAAYRLKDEAATPRVHEVVARPADPPSDLQVQAGLALARRGDAAAVPVLVRALTSCGADVALCRDVIEGAARLKDARAVPPLLERLPDVLNRRERVFALGEIADPSVVPALIERLAGDEYVPVRVEAAQALGKIGGAQARAALAASARREREVPVRQAARAALKSVGRAQPGARVESRTQSR